MWNRSSREQCVHALEDPACERGVSRTSTGRGGAGSTRRRRAGPGQRPCRTPSNDDRSRPTMRSAHRLASLSRCSPRSAATAGPGMMSTPPAITEMAKRFMRLLDVGAVRPDEPARALSPLLVPQPEQRSDSVRVRGASASAPRCRSLVDCRSVIPPSSSSRVSRRSVRRPDRSASELVDFCRRPPTLGSVVRGRHSGGLEATQRHDH